MSKHIKVNSENRALLSELRRAGWTLSRTKGSHYVFENSDRSHKVTVPHPWKPIDRGLQKTIRRQIEHPELSRSKSGEGAQ